jgi:HAD superfamily hydrolase (TIGR01544 family)
MLSKSFDNPNIYIKDKISFEEKINNFNLKDLPIVADFDSTISQENLCSSWAPFAMLWVMPEEYCKEHKELFDYYYPLEIDQNIPFAEKDIFMKQWWQKHLELFIKYKLDIKIVDNIISNKCFIFFRNWMKEFIDYSYLKQIPFIILSAGITNVIDRFLDFYWAYHSNLHIVSNELEFNENGFCVWINKSFVIHSQNKDEHDMPEKIKKLVAWKKDIILLWDKIADIKMIDENLREGALKIWFLANLNLNSKDKYVDNFDIVIESDTDSFWIPGEILQSIK